MNLFLVGWKLPPELRSRAVVELGKMASVYPQLDPATLWHQEAPLTFAASMYTGDRAAGPRRYVHRDANQIVFYDGSLVERGGCFAAHDARVLGLHWDEFEEIEGQYVAVRVTVNPPRMELVTDWFGFHQTYYHRFGDAWVVSNNVRLIRRLIDGSELDPMGVSMMLNMGWVGGDRTLEREIRVVPAAQHWIWDARSREPRETTYYPRVRLAHLKHRWRRPSFRRLADEMVETCRRFAASYGRLKCPLTGGRDTRLLAALLVHGQIDADYYTSGAPGSSDVAFAQILADLYGLRLEIRDQPAAAVIEAWEDTADRLIQQNDGLVNLVQIADLVLQPREIGQLALSLWGIGGEIARGNYLHPRIFLFDRRVDTIREHIFDLFADHHGGLIDPECTVRTRHFLREFVERAVDDGFEPLDIGDLFFTFDRVRRWAGSNERKSMPAGDRYSPFLNRGFVEAAFSISALSRLTEPSHFHLTRLLAPDMHRLPFATGGWSSQWPALNLWRQAAHGTWRKVRGRIQAGMRGRIQTQTPTQPAGLSFDHALWLEAKLPWLRALCLDQSASPLWEFVQRPVFEKITGKQSSPETRRQFMRGLYNVGTVFAYVESR